MTLPAGWTETTLDTITRDGSPICYGVLKPGDPSPGGVRMVRVTDIRHNQLDESGLITISDELDQEFHRSRVVAGDVLISVQGTVGRVAVVPETLTNANISRTIARIRVIDGVEPRWLWRTLLAPQFRRISGDQVAGTTRDSLNIGTLRQLKVPLPPVAEQRRICAKLDVLMGQLARARAELDRVPPLARRLRERALADAFGAAHPDSDGVAVTDLCTSITDGDHQAPPRATEGIPFITISAMSNGTIDLSKATRFVPESYAESLKDARRPRLGDVLYSVTGSIGIPALVRDDRPFVFQRHIAILRPDPRRCDAEWLVYMLAAPQVFAQAEAVATGTAQLTIPLSGLRSFVLPNVPKSEQRRQVARLNAAFGRVDRLEAEMGRAHMLLDRLEAATLAQAFRGELVPQDPCDEPAGALLDRVQASRIGISRMERVRRSTVGQPDASPRRSISQRESKMTKSRRDDDVMEKPYLAEKLKDMRGGSVQELFRAADLPVADFYKQLAWEIDNNHIVDDSEVLKAA